MFWKSIKWRRQIYLKNNETFKGDTYGQWLMFILYTVESSMNVDSQSQGIPTSLGIPLGIP